MDKGWMMAMDDRFAWLDDEPRLWGEYDAE